MRIPQRTAHFMLVLEAVILIIVLVLGIISPITAPEKNQTGNSTGSELGSTNENQIGGTQGTEGTEVEKPEDSEKPAEPLEPVFSKEILAKVDAMTLEQKVAQMFIVTPEALAKVDKVTVMGNTTKNALKQYPVGGFVYSSKNFQNKAQTTKMLKAVQEFCKKELGTPMLLMVEERGGADYSPLASANGYKVQASPSEIGSTGDVQNAIDAVKEISKYLKEAGFNMNLAPNTDSYASNSSVTAMMVAETVSSYGQQKIMTVMSMFPGKSDGAFMNDTKEEWEAAEGLAFKGGINAGVNAIMVGNVYASAFTGNDATSCSMSEEVVKYIRANMQYQGVLISDSLSESIVTSNFTSAQAAVAVVSAGMDMIYCPANFEEAYQGVLDAVNSGVITEEMIDESVARILTCKQTI